MNFLISTLILFVCLDGAVAESNERSAPDSKTSERDNYGQARKAYLQQVNLSLAKGKLAEAGEAYIALGELTQVRGAFPAAETAYKKGLALLNRETPANDLRRVIAMDDLGWLYVTWGRLTDGSRLMEEARIRAELVPPNDGGLVRHLDAQAAYCVVVGRYSEATKDWNRALDIAKISYGPDSPNYANILVHVAQGGSIARDYSLAEQTLRRYLATGENSTTPIGRAVAQGELAHICVQLHRFPEAQSWFEISLSPFDMNPDPAPLVHATILSYLGDFSMEQRDWASARSQFREALRIQQSVLGENNAVAESMLSLSKALKKLHLKDESKALLSRAKIILAASKSPFQGNTVDVMALRRR